MAYRRRLVRRRLLFGRESLSYFVWSCVVSGVVTLLNSTNFTQLRTFFFLRVRTWLYCNSKSHETPTSVSSLDVRRISLQSESDASSFQVLRSATALENKHSSHT